MEGASLRHTWESRAKNRLTTMRLGGQAHGGQSSRVLDTRRAGSACDFRRRSKVCPSIHSCGSLPSLPALSDKEYPHSRRRVAVDAMPSAVPIPPESKLLVGSIQPMSVSSPILHRGRHDAVGLATLEAQRNQKRKRTGHQPNNANLRL